MTFTLQNTINWALPFLMYSPVTAGVGNEPASTIASIIRNSILSASTTWSFNRAEQTFPTVAGQQDYTIATVPDLAFIEKVSLTDDQGNIYEVKDVYNNSALAVSAFQQRPNAISIESSSIITNVLNYKFRFLGVPDKIYTVTLTYQKLAPQFGPFFITSAANASGGNTAYTGSFDPLSFPVGSTATISGFVANVVNNGSFTVVTCTTTTLTVANAAGVAETIAAYANNFSWDPIPNQFSDIYNNLFLSEAMTLVDDPRAQLYRQRGVAAFLSKAHGLTEMQKNIFAQQWLQRVSEASTIGTKTQQAVTARGV
jgi:hypothetical protein